DQHHDDDAYQAGEEQREPTNVAAEQSEQVDVAEHRPGGDEEADDADAGADEDAVVERAHDVVVGRQAHELGADDARDDGDGAEYQRVGDEGGDIAGAGQ